jgi:micrococcal nuclease
MRLIGQVTLALVLLGCDGGTGSDDEAGSQCGPSSATVVNVVDGDTIDLDSGERVRYLMIDAPESTSEVECWGGEAKQTNVDLVMGQQVELYYDQECEDQYGRLLAYVVVKGKEINRTMVERGHACVLHIPPNGDDVVDEYESLEYAAEMLNKGLWAACDPNPCN